MKKFLVITGLILCVSGCVSTHNSRFAEDMVPELEAYIKADTNLNESEKQRRLDRCETFKLLTEKTEDYK